MRKRVVMMMSTLLAVGCATAGPRQTSFDVSHVTLYDCGLAQMEREVDVNGETELQIPLPLAHLDDLLATLVVAARGDVRVTGVRYPSVFTLGQARAASSFANAAGDEEKLLEKDASELCRYVLAMVGTEVEVTRSSGPALSGTVVDCALGTHKGGTEDSEAQATEHLLLVSPAGAMAWVPLDQVDRVSPTSPREGEAIHTYARHLGRAPGLSETSVRIQTAPGSSGRLGAGYVQQAPVWRMSYKLRVDGGKVYLEAWGLVHNDTDENWDRINLTLVSGLPESYVLSVASPRYAERDGLLADGGTDMYPQLGAATPDSLLYDESVIRYAYGVGGGVGFGAKGVGHAGMVEMSSRSMSQAYGVAGRAASGGASMLVKVEDSAVEETAEPAVEEEISTYRALEAVTIPPRASSMVPLLKRQLPGESFTLVGQGDPQTCVRMTNTSGLVLQYGVASFYINGRYRGQTELSRAEPGDIRVLCFGHDPDVESSRELKTERELKAVEYRHNTLYGHSLDTYRTTHTLTNRSGQVRTMALQVTPHTNGRIIEPAHSLPGEDRERYILVHVPARGEVQQQVVTEAGMEHVVPTGVDYLAALLEEARPLGSDIAAVLEKSLARARERDEHARASARHHGDLEKVQASLERKRNSVQAIPAAAVATSAGNKLLEEMLVTEKKLEKMLVEQEEFDRQFEVLERQVNETLATLPKPRVK